jgi:hypothetical protein
MSLVGNLEDLSLGDILQIISLSQKSGVFALASDQGSGRIVFRSGLVQAACLKGGANDLRELLIGGGLIDSAGYDAALSYSQGLGVDVEETLASEAGLTAGRIDALIQETVEAAVLEMFTWPAGDFSFGVRSEPDPEDPDLMMLNGLNAQYLAMEGLRLSDERARDSVGGTSGALNEAPQSPTQEMIDDPIFGSDLLEDDSDEGFCESLFVEPEDVADGTLDFGESPSVSEIGEGLDSLGFDPFGVATAELGFVTRAAPELTAAAAAPLPIPVAIGEAAGVLVNRVIEQSNGLDLLDEVAASPERTAASVQGAEPAELVSDVPTRRSTDRDMALLSLQKMPVVLIDPDVIVLEWVKAAIEGSFARVHVFQQAEQGLARIRQYLIRGEVPLVLLSWDTQIDPLSGIHGLADFVRRLKAQAPRLVVLGLRENEDVAMPAMLDGVLRRPGRRVLSERSAAAGEVTSQALVRALRKILSQEPEAVPEAAQPVQQDIERQALRETTARLREASSRSEILPVVLDFASEIFERVAILIVRDGDLFAISGRGIPSLEVDPMSSAPSVTLEAVGAGWVREVLESNQAIVGSAETPADFELLHRFGGEHPSSVYLSPIESDASVAALLYGDQGSTERAIPGTSGLEVVLQHAGLALDRAALERALWEAHAESQ